MVSCVQNERVQFYRDFSTAQADKANWAAEFFLPGSRPPTFNFY
jgi:hypothetical protein